MIVCVCVCVCVLLTEQPLLDVADQLQEHKEVPPHEEGVGGGVGCKLPHHVTGRTGELRTTGLHTTQDYI